MSEAHDYFFQSILANLRDELREKNSDVPEEEYYIIRLAEISDYLTKETDRKDESKLKNSLLFMLNEIKEDIEEAKSGLKKDMSWIRPIKMTEDEKKKCLERSLAKIDKISELIEENLN